jgi:hypothetical protein
MWLSRGFVDPDPLTLTWVTGANVNELNVLDHVRGLQEKDTESVCEWMKATYCPRNTVTKLG